MCPLKIISSYCLVKPHITIFVIDINCVVIMKFVIAWYNTVHVSQINIYFHRSEWPVISWIVSPIIGRMPRTIISTPEEIENHRPANKYRFYNIIYAKNIRIANYLNINFRRISLFNYYGCYVLISISIQYCLNNDKM